MKCELCCIQKVIYDHVSGPLLHCGLKLAKHEPEQHYTRSFQSQLTRMGFITIQQFFEILHNAIRRV